MYDLWYALGNAITSATAKPSLLDSILLSIGADVAFKRLKARIFTEIGSNGSTITIPNTKTAGLLDPVVTFRVRNSIRTYFKTFQGAPPVSYYSAGKLAQFLAIGVIDSQAVGGPLDFVKIIKKANGAFTSIGGPTAVSPGFTALLGLCLIDETARSVIAGSVDPKSDLLAEFAVTDAGEQSRVTSIAGHPDFFAAQKSFLEGDGNTWNPNEGSSEQFFTWVDHSERAVY